MDMVALKASARTALSPTKLRESGKVPGVIYGHGIATRGFEVERKLLTKAYHKAGESTLVELDMDGEKIPALFKQFDKHVVSGDVIHVDFYAVNMKEEIEAKVPVHLTDESPAVKDLSAILVTPMLEVTVRALPANLPHALDASLSQLKEFGDTITVKDLKVAAGVVIVDDAEAVIALVQEPRAAEEVVVAAPEAAAGAEGAAPAAGAEGAAAPADAKKEEKK